MRNVCGRRLGVTDGLDQQGFMCQGQILDPDQFLIMTSSGLQHGKACFALRTPLDVICLLVPIRKWPICGWTLVTRAPCGTITLGPLNFPIQRKIPCAVASSGSGNWKNSSTISLSINLTARRRPTTMWHPPRRSWPLRAWTTTMCWIDITGAWFRSGPGISPSVIK